MVLDVGEGTIGIREVIDDRFETERAMRASDFRLDFVRLIATEDSRRPGGWTLVEGAPFDDVVRALDALRRGEARTQDIGGIELDEHLKKIRDTTMPHLTLWGHPAASLLYRFGERGFREAEPEVAAFLEHGDAFVRRAAVWALTRHWGAVEYQAAILAVARDDEDALVRQMATIGLGILLRGTHDTTATRFLAGLLKNSGEKWFLREAAYLALLGIWRPRTSELRETWRGWRPWGIGKTKGGSWDEEWSDRVNWDLVAPLEAEAP